MTAARPDLETAREYTALAIRGKPGVPAARRTKPVAIGMLEVAGGTVTGRGPRERPRRVRGRAVDALPGAPGR